MRRMILVGVIGLTLASSVHARDSHDGVSPAESFFGGLVQEQDVTLVFDYLRAAFAAALAGQELAPPEQLTRRAEVIGEELRLRGVALGRALLDAIELSVRESVKEAIRLPPSSALQR